MYFYWTILLLCKIKCFCLLHNCHKHTVLELCNQITVGLDLLVIRCFKILIIRLQNFLLDYKVFQFSGIAHTDQPLIRWLITWKTDIGCTAFDHWIYRNHFTLRGYSTYFGNRLILPLPQS